MQYRPPLDGIRAIAITAVLIYHVAPAALGGGFTGVDVFFVLSGYLITSIILHDLRHGSFSFREFYLRRIQRLVPNSVMVVVGILLFWMLLMPPSGTAGIGTHGLWTLFNLSNIYTWRNLGGYWDDTVELAPLAHTWSLGVEEQFYLFFPVALWLLTWRNSNRVWAWLAASAILSFAFCLYGTQAHPAATFYLLPTRVWELLMGGGLAAFGSRGGLNSEPAGMWIGTKLRELTGWVGMSLLGAGFFLIDESIAFPGWAALVPTVGTLLLLLSVTTMQTRVSRLLSTTGFVSVGRLSYSLYLWHWPMITLGKFQAGLYGFSPLWGSIIGALFGLLLSWGAYVLIEQPLRRRGVGRSRRLVLISVGFGLGALFCGFCAFRKPSASHVTQFTTSTFSIGLFNAGRDESLKRMATKIPFHDIRFPQLPPPQEASWRTGGIIHRHGGDRPQVVVMGSSHALMYSRVIDSICGELGLSAAFFGVTSTSPFFEETVNSNFRSIQEVKEFNSARRKWLREWRPEVLFVIDKWDGRLGSNKVFDENLRSFLKEVSPLVGRVLFVAQIPVVKGGNQFNLRDLVSWQMGKTQDPPRLEPDANEDLRKQAVAITEAAQGEFPNLRVIRADRPFYSQDGSIRYASGRTFFYADDNHLTDEGAEQLRSLFRSAISEP